MRTNTSKWTQTSIFISGLGRRRDTVIFSSFFFRELVGHPVCDYKYLSALRSKTEGEEERWYVWYESEGLQLGFKIPKCVCMSIRKKYFFWMVKWGNLRMKAGISMKEKHGQKCVTLRTRLSWHSVNTNLLTNKLICWTCFLLWWFSVFLLLSRHFLLFFALPISDMWKAAQKVYTDAFVISFSRDRWPGEMGLWNNSASLLPCDMKSAKMVHSASSCL